MFSSVAVHDKMQFFRQFLLLRSEDGHDLAHRPRPRNGQFGADRLSVRSRGPDCALIERDGRHCLMQLLAALGQLLPERRGDLPLVVEDSLDFSLLCIVQAEDVGWPAFAAQTACFAPWEGAAGAAVWSSASAAWAPAVAIAPARAMATRFLFIGFPSFCSDQPELPENL